MTKKVLVTERLAEAGLAVLRDKGCEVDVKLKMTPEELIETVPGYDALIVRSAIHCPGGRCALFLPHTH